jgi:hypothetical protein
MIKNKHLDKKIINKIIALQKRNFNKVLTNKIILNLINQDNLQVNKK